MQKLRKSKTKKHAGEKLKEAEKGQKKGFKIALVGQTLTSTSQEAFTLYDKSRLGQVMNGKVNFSFIEALYLCEKNKASVYEGKKRISFNSLLEKAKKYDDNLWPKFAVFRDLRNRGYIIKTALKFGADFRVYEKGIKPGQDHAKWIVFPVHENSKLTWHEFSAKNRVAHSTKKNLLIAIVDEEGDVTYYEVSWLRP